MRKRLTRNNLPSHVIPGVVDGEDDDVKEDTDNVDSKTEKDWLLTVRHGQAPH